MQARFDLLPSTDRLQVTFRPSLNPEMARLETLMDLLGGDKIVRTVETQEGSESVEYIMKVPLGALGNMVKGAN